MERDFPMWSLTLRRGVLFVRRGYSLLDGGILCETTGVFFFPLGVDFV